MNHHNPVPAAYSQPRAGPPQNVQHGMQGQNGNTFQVPQGVSMNNVYPGGFYAGQQFQAVNPQQYNGYADASMGTPQYDVYSSQMPVQQMAGFSMPNQSFYYPQQFGAGVPQQPYIQPVASDAQYGGNYASTVQPPYQQTPTAQPTTAPTQAQAIKREKKLLNFKDPASGKSVIEGAEEKPVEVPELTPEEISKKESDEKKTLFRMKIMETMNDQLKGEETKEPVAKPDVAASLPEAPKVVQQPVPASSAPPPSISVVEESSQQTKSASVEPSMQNELPTQSHSNASLTVERPPSPPLKNDVKEQQIEEDSAEKRLGLARSFKEVYEANKEQIEKKVYSFEVLAMIREIVKCIKKTPVPADLDLLKRKGLEINSELPQQMQGRSKYSNPSTFNPNWNNNQQNNIVGRKMYTGRHSDNKRMPKKNITARASFDRPRQPPPPPVLDLRKADNAWKPKRRGEVELSEEEKKTEAFRKDVRSILNKITPTSYDGLIEDFFKMDVGQSETFQQIAIELIFDKAVEEPKFCSLYTQLCKQQVDRGKRTSGSFFYTLIQKVQSTFEGNSAFETNKAELAAQLESETDERKKADLEERLDMLKEKEKRYILGNIKFISHLYTVDLIADHIIAFCLSNLHRMFGETNDEIYVQYGIELLELILKLYTSDEKREKRAADKGSADNVQSFVQWLSTDECKSKVSTKIRVMIMNFEDFKKSNFQKRNMNTGPKKISELHDDIRKEEEMKRNERMAYEAQKQNQDRYSQQRTPYAGRNSLERNKHNLTEKRTNAVAASMNTGSMSGMSNRKNMKMLDKNSMTDKIGKSSFFSRKTQPEDAGAHTEASEAKNANAGANTQDEEGWKLVQSGGGQNQSRKSASLEQN